MSETVFSMFEDSNGTFWMGVDGRGLYSFDKKTGRLKLVYAMEEDFTSIRCITEDSHRRLYAAVMGKGCLCYDLQTGKSRLFTYEEGGRGMANAWVTSVFCDSQDRIWFGHFGGVSCYDIRNGCLSVQKSNRVVFTLLPKEKTGVSGWQRVMVCFAMTLHVTSIR